MALSSNLESGPLQMLMAFGTLTKTSTIDQVPGIRIEKNETRKISNGSNRLNNLDMEMLASGALFILDTSNTRIEASNSEDRVSMEDFQRTKVNNQSLLYEIEAMTTFLQTLEHITEELIEKMDSIYDELCQVEYVKDLTHNIVKLVSNSFAFGTRPETMLLSLEWKVFEFGNTILKKLAVLGDDIRDHMLLVNSLGMEFVNLTEEFASFPIESRLHIEDERFRLNVEVQEICRISTRNLDTFLNFQAIEYDQTIRYDNLENEIEKFDSMHILLMSLQSKESISK